MANELHTIKLGDTEYPLRPKSFQWTSNTITSNANDTTAKWGGLGCTLHFYSTSGQLKDQPSQYGLLFNLNKGSEVHQLWLEQAGGSISHRGGNSGGWNGTWKKILDDNNYTSWVYPKTDVYTKTETGTAISTAINNLAGVARSGSYNDLLNKPTIPTIPTSLPANGGNASTVNGFTVGCNVPADAKFTDNDTKVTTVGNHYTPTANGAFELTATISGTAGTYTKDKEYTVLTGVKAQRDAAGHVTGLTYTAQKIKDTDTTYTSLKNPHSLTIQKNGITVTNGTYDGSAAKTVDITVPTKVSDLTNDSGYITTYTDTKNTTGADNTNSKIFLVGSISQTTNNTAARTYSNSKCYASGGYLYSNGKAVINENATETTDGLMSIDDKKKLNGIASGANNYTHPTTEGNKHIPSGGSIGQFLGWNSKGTAKWVSNPNSDTKNTAGTTNNRNTKLYLAGATSQDNNPQTYSNSGCYIGTNNALYSDHSRTITGLRVTNEYGLSNTAKAGSGGNVNLSAGDGISISVEDENTIRIDCDITVSDTKVKQSSLTTSGNYPILMAYSTSPTTGTANQAYYNTGVYINPYTKNVYATGFYETSDANLKNFNSDIDIDFDKIKQLPKKYFTWKDGDQIQHIGTSAQEIQKIYPELVSDSDGTLTVDYAKLSVIALAAVDKLVDKQKEIEDRLAKLEAIVSKLTE